MLEMRAIVIQVQGDEASVQALSNGCGQCNGAGGCGSGTLSKLFCGSQPRHFNVHNEVHAKVGDEVQVSLPDGVLLRSAVRMYVLPLALLMAGGALGVTVAGETALRDAYAVVGAVLGLLSGFGLARYSSFKAGRAVASSIITNRSGC
ncbi:MAG TPA: SoxR reducing system RseC family protein [Sideroxyarcus sp.]|nr:SoxR reducing system RseC family protein [Sideroxyarcus sp.]